MKPGARRAAALATVALTAVAAPSAFADSGVSRGPSTTKNPYVIPVADGVQIKSILTTGDQPADNGYGLVGIPDGLGAVRDGNNVTVLANHELRATQGVVRRHGQKGAFVSRWSIDRRTLRVKSGSDLINPGVQYYDYVAQTFGAAPSAGGANPRNPADLFPAQSAPFARFCSSSLTDVGQLYNARSGRGYDGQLYFANEENGDEGRAFGVTADGDAKQLPRLGLFSMENTLVSRVRSDRTVVIGNEDGAAGPNGQLSVYVGTKSRKGDAFRRAGLTNGTRYVLDAENPAVKTDADWRSAVGKGVPADVGFNEVEWDASGARQNAEGIADGLGLNRIEDGAFDPNRPDDYYFVTTEGAPDPSPSAGGRDGGGLWRLRFEDVEHPELGASLTLLLDGSEAPFLFKPDNIDIDRRGNLLIQEDPGNVTHIARIVAYRLGTGERSVLATFDPAIFAPGSTAVEATVDEESSGIVDTSRILGGSTFLFDAQVHRAYTTGGAPAGYAPDPTGANVEFGQLLSLKVDWDAVWGDDHHGHDD